jgi:precorrin-6B methylase 2
MAIADPFQSVFPYETTMQMGLAYKPQSKRVLHIGLGGGSIVKRMWRDFPELQMDVVELDKQVVSVAKQFFALPSDPRIQIHVDDGRQYLVKTDQKFDLIVIDAFFSDSIPAHLTTREFLELARTRLTPGGAIVTNIIGATQGEQSQLFRAIYRTYAEQFPTLLVHPVEDDPGSADDDEVRNIVLVATDGPRPERDFLQSRWAEIRRTHTGAPDLDEAIETRREAPVPTDDVPTLTDDYAPTDALLLVL